MTGGDHDGVRGRILVVEDDRASADLLAALLEEEGFQPVVCGDGRSVLDRFQSDQPVAVLIDWVIPGGPGIDLCRQIRARDSKVPIFFVSGRTDEASVSRGLDAGADDFMTKPLRPRELVARLEAHLRKVGALPTATGANSPSTAVADATRSFGDVEIDLEARIARVRGTPVTLGSLEFRLLEYFVRNAGVALSRTQILNEVHGYDDIPTERVDLLVRRLRAKLNWGDWITAVPGYGYRLERPGK
ncbi:MAG: response regulator transcription factor [Candidatus Dormibacteraeota bacterium]|nr:response regulator transcription factor [Candidatus Dormibacteraeota bacterium]